MAFLAAAAVPQPLMQQAQLQSLWQQARADFQRLEFLGDAILGALVAEELYRRWPDASEGSLTMMRSRMVCSETLADCACRQGMDLLDGAAVSDKRLADSLEALLGALFVQQGYQHCREQLLRWLHPDLDALHPDTDYRHPKTRLQEILMSEGEQPPQYEVSLLPDGQVRVRCQFVRAGQQHSMEQRGTNARQAGLLAAEQGLQFLLGEPGKS